MQSAKSIMLERFRLCFIKKIFTLFFIAFSITVSAQDNSPYSRYGLGDLVPATNVSTRGLGGISAGYVDVISINYNNPASYSQFQTYLEQRSKRISAGRVILDVGVNLDNRTLVVPNTPERFSVSNLFFSYLQVGLPIRKNWGMSFGIRPVSHIGYAIDRRELLKDPVTGNPIDSAITQFRGSGGSYMPNIGTGFAIGNFSAGLNAGYLFGSRENTTFRNLISRDSLLYYASDHTTSTSFGDIFFNAGLQYKINLNKSTFLRLGVSGNWQQKLKASQDVLRQTYNRGSAGEELQIDSIYHQKDVKGEIVYPASYKAGFVVQHTKDDNSGWLLGVDYTQNKWSDYRFFGQRDSVRNNWQVNVGAQLFPKGKAGYFSRTTYRFGFYTGPDYIKLQNDLPQFGVSFGMGLPIANFNRLSPNQYTVLNLALEYGKRGDNKSLLKENLFRVSLSFNFTDLWFGKKKYD
jgi:hypothetical protein